MRQEVPKWRRGAGRWGYRGAPYRFSCLSLGLAYLLAAIPTFLLLLPRRPSPSPGEELKTQRPSVKPMQLTHAPKWTGSTKWPVISPVHRVITACRTHVWDKTRPTEPPGRFWENSKGKIAGAYSLTPLPFLGSTERPCSPENFLKQIAGLLGCLFLTHH